MKSIQTWVIVGLGVVIILMLLFDRDPPSYDTTQWKDSISKANDRIVTLQGERAKLSRKIAEDSILQAEEKQDYQKSIISLQARLQVKRVRIDTLLLESPALREYVATADSVIQFQSVRIDSLESDLSGMRDIMRKVASNFEAQISAEQEKFSASQQEVKILEKQVKRESRKVKVWKALSVIGTVGGLLIGLQ